MKYYTSTTEFNCGIDLHARQMYGCLMDRQGTIRLYTNIQNNDFEFFLKRIEAYRHDLTVCCECMFGWYWLADACQAAGLESLRVNSMSFWTAPRRCITALEGLRGWTRTPHRPIESRIGV